MYRDDAPTLYEIALEEMSAWNTSELLSELEDAINELDFRQGQREYLLQEFSSLESAPRGSERFKAHVDNIRRGLRCFDCIDAADRANAILDLLVNQKNVREPIGSWEY